MDNQLRYPIGIQTFSEIRTGNYIYVDKTELIYRLVKGNKYIFLSRPRRFGKSLLMSTLEAYYHGRKELFEGLAISRLESEWIDYPVFRFDLSGEDFDNTEALTAHISGLLDDIEEEYGLESVGTISRRFKLLLRRASEKFGQKVVVLIDEYDKPMLDSLQDDDLNEKIRNKLAGFYAVLKASDENIQFAMITGVTKFSHVSVFSALNNLKDISMMPEYNALCGISEAEFHRDFRESVRIFSETHNQLEEETWHQFKCRYDGYHFAIPGEYVYNPFSMLMAFDRMQFGSWWFSTGSASFLVKLVKRYHFLLGNLEGARRKENALNDISNVGRDFVPLLYQAGYLTLKDYDAATGEYTLGFPNHEVSEGFWESLAEFLFVNRVGDSSFDVRLFLDEVYHGKPNDFMKRLQTLFADTESVTESNKEIHFQNMMATVCKMMGLTVSTEIRSALGRCDMVIATPGYIYIFEFKVDGSPEKALEQIKERDYAGRFAVDDRTVFLIGANYSTKRRNIDSWLIETA